MMILIWFFLACFLLKAAGNRKLTLPITESVETAPAVSCFYRHAIFIPQKN
ncbi:Uncharacterized protein dnm_040450 [Desulfonema magnum]|uniref:Uncharacterized protein n=1 Tax=Desulfonema magnum TaxID=45655 RepID=A0A975GNP8_9BACT|nr:Uncharacterized protein dnm_040450 [Desulfonema magnum]